MRNIHPTAIVDPKAEIDENVKIGPYCVIDAGVRLGKSCSLDSHVRIKGQTTIGPDNQFFHACIVGELPQDMSFQKGSHSSLTMGEGNVVREYAQIHSSTLEKGTLIGDHNFIMSLAHIAHDVRIGDHNIIVQGAILGGHSLLEDYVYISALTALHPQVKVGSYAIIGGISGVAQDVPPYVMAQGERAVAHGLNSLGMRRAHFSPELRKVIKQAYKILFIEETSVRKGLDRIQKEIMEKYKTDSEEFSRIKHFVNFIKSSKRGIISAKKEK